MEAQKKQEEMAQKEEEKKQADRAEREERAAAKREKLAALAESQFIRMRDLKFDEAQFDYNPPRLLGIESMVAVLVVKCGMSEKDLRTKQKFKDRAAILELFRSKLAVFREAAMPAVAE